MVLYFDFSSMFVDEDGDVANEFYYEVPGDKSRNQQRPVLLKKNPLLLKAQVYFRLLLYSKLFSIGINFSELFVGLH